MYSHNIILLFQDKFQFYEQYHVYQSEYMNDKSNDHSKNRLKKSVTPNILFKFLLNKFEDENNQDYDLNVNEYVLYKNQRKKEMMMIKKKRLSLIVMIT